MTSTISIGNYLLKRLKEINIETIFGVPGDYNMVSRSFSDKITRPYQFSIHLFFSLSWI